ncbi:hypothetical protein SHIRM173S_11865 [Streptomyces hirsutus]
MFVNDPGKGRRFVPLEEFDGSFTGVVLVLEPGPQFTRGGRRPGVLGAMPARLRGTAGTMPAVVLSSLLLVAVGAAVPGLSRTFIDEFLIGRRTSMLGVLFTSMGACVLLTLVLTWLQQANLLRGRIISSTLSSARFLRHLLRLPVTFFGQRSPADLVQRLQSNDAVAETLSRDLSAAGVDVVVVVLYAVLLYTYNPRADLRRGGGGAAERPGDADRHPAARDPYGETARGHRAAHQHGVHRSAADRDDEGDRR